MSSKVNNDLSKEMQNKKYLIRGFTIQNFFLFYLEYCGRNA